MVYDADNILGDEGVLCLSGDIDDKTAAWFIPWFVAQNAQPLNGKGKKKTHLTLMICSSGGSMAPNWAMIDVIMSSKLPVHTVGLGQICSCGLLLFLAGKKRTLTRSCSVMAHQFWSGTTGKYHELVDAQDRWNQVDQMMFEYYLRITNLTAAQIRKKLMGPGEHYYTARQARRLGLCDHVTNTWGKK